MDVSVIIVNYNTYRLLSECLETLYAQTIGIQFEVIVVDNASNDDSEKNITKLYPQVKWLNSGSNIGFGRANNLGYSYASGKYIFLLNSDTLLANNAIKAFYDYAEMHINEQIGVLGCWLLDRNGNINNSYGQFPSPRSETNYLLGKIRLNIKHLQRKGVIDVDYVIGADMFIHREVFEKFEGFDSNFFMYYEETDLQYRMAKAGYIRRIIDQPQIIHFEGGSFTKKGLTFNRYMMAQRSYLYYIAKHYKGIKYITFRFFLCILRSFIFFQRNWTVKERFYGFLTTLTNWK